MKFSCILVDDEPIAHTVLKTHLSRFEELELVGSFFNAARATEFLGKNAVDLMFLDIQMPGMNGLELLSTLENKPVTILTTAFRDYALEGFDLGVIDYLVKPVEPVRFEIAVRRSLDFIKLSKAAQAVDFVRSAPEKNFDIVVKTGLSTVVLDYRTISFAQGLKDYTILHTENKKYVVKGYLKLLEEFLPEDYFLRVHKSFIVARGRIKHILKNKIEVGSMQIPIGRSFKDDVDRFLESKK